MNKSKRKRPENSAKTVIVLFGTIFWSIVCFVFCSLQNGKEISEVQGFK
jgi:hypothetical protein